MGFTGTCLAYLCASLLCLAGCATSPMKQAAYSDPQRTEKLNSLRAVCMSLRVGSQVTIQFYGGEGTSQETETGKSMTGYFYAYNKMNDVLYISSKPLSFFDRGQPYELHTIASIVTAPPSVKAAFPVVKQPLQIPSI